MKPKRPISRFVRTVRASLLICLIGVALGAYSGYISRRDTSLAVGPKSDAQREFFVGSADRPDLADFFKSMKHEQRVAMARNIGRYQAPELAKLIGTCLADFDADARAELAKSLAIQAVKYPGAVAEQLKLTGSFQSLGVKQALYSVGPNVVPDVVKQLSVGDARNNAITFLVSIGAPAIPPLVASLNDKSADVRKAASDALGKIGSREAIPSLVAKYNGTASDERIAYLSAIASIGDPLTEALLARNLRDDDAPLSTRAIAAIGLGRVATPSAATLLWEYASHPDKDFVAQIMSALQLAGDVSLRVAHTDRRLQVLVAAKITSSLADEVIARALPSIEAIQAASERPQLVAQLKAVAPKLSATTDGDRIDSLVQALMTTEPGKAVLASMENRAEYTGFIERRRRLSS